MIDRPGKKDNKQPSPSINFIYFTGTISALASSATLVATLYGLLFLVRPNLKPPEKLGASLSKVVLEEGVTFNDYVRRSDKSGYSRGDIPKDRNGKLVYIQFDIQGFQSREYGTFITLMDAKTQWAVSEQPTWDSVRYKPAASSDKAVLYAWISDPEQEGIYFLRIRLYDQGLAKGNPRSIEQEPTEGMLDVADSKQFTVGSS